MEPVFSAEHHSQQVQLCLAYRCWHAVAAPSATLTLAALCCGCWVSLGHIKALCISSKSFLQIGCLPTVVVPNVAVLVVRRIIQMQVFPHICRFRFMFSANEERQTKSKPTTAVSSGRVRVFRLLSGLCNMTLATKTQQCWADTEL